MVSSNLATLQVVMMKEKRAMIGHVEKLSLTIAPGSLQIPS